ncbi:TetR/AcrR family transcriptional regulator [Rhizobium sp. MC63]|uniref:TetR/AcrR family transcriptional repressor of nem operon n=2 Tax=Rhizobium TaxID=379 RepID=A0A7W8XED3_9HYPH|nr:MULTISPECIES: TetR/AcrR family transcriptional regulator [Rhizobium]MBB4574490.1 TetR/AcrR family transcriptional repressor of nem operon [Rhizobium lentis]MBB5550417.1 TetR/AcrR family transcriptional repressor of nem operon [Rhizobium lentis]MBB5560556.1 TetR/AcrR family transcriptional repressor of nem operon [Rhizobium lentis]MBB5567141.1 TetR/AcrR family transcriptional repressor of nem operon [Rhizobium lentis]MDF0697815.1 TetR/AcrR family transcriptional regulator [Rhizobium sp. MC63
MGRSQLEKQKTHEKIVETASRRLREAGLDGISVADLMKEAGLTVGGFYKHFASRDDLVAEAIQSAFDSWGSKLEAEGINPAEMTAADIAERYISTYHRDNPGEGCPFAALTSDISRSGQKARAIATEGLRRNFAGLGSKAAGADEGERRRKAIMAFAMMAGGIGLARISSDEALSAEILETIRDFVGAIDK